MNRITDFASLSSLSLFLSFSLATIFFFSSCKKNDFGETVTVDCAGTNTSMTIYYVSTSGDDNNDGLSEATAFRTIAKGLGSVRPGGTVRIKPGTYNESLTIARCGSSAAAITVEGHGGRPLLDGGNQLTYAIFCENCDNYVFRNLDIRNYTDFGIASSYANGFVLKDLHVSENGHAVQLKSWNLEGYGIHIEHSVDVEVSDCKTFRNGPEPQISPDYIMGTGINTFGNTDVVIRNNESYDNIGGGMLVEDSYNVLVEDNEAYDNDCDASVDQWWDAGLWLDGGGNVTVRNNSFHGNLGCGIEISDEDRQNPTGYVLENNTSTGNYFGIFIWNFGTNTWPDSTILRNDSTNSYTGNSRQDVWIVDWI